MSAIKIYQWCNEHIGDNNNIIIIVIDIVKKITSVLIALSEIIGNYRELIKKR